MLTKAGEEALKEAKRIEEHIHTIHRRLQGRDFRISGNLRISTTDTLGYYWLPPYIRRFKAQYPDITIHMDIKTGYTDLARREADIVILV